MMIALAIGGTVAWLGTAALVAYLGRELLHALDAKWRSEREIEVTRVDVLVREVKVKERAMTLTEQEKAQRPTTEEMPEDLRVRIRAWEDSWAREGAEAEVWALYNEHKDWDAVRRNLTTMPIRNDNQPEGMIQ